MEQAAFLRLASDEERRSAVEAGFNTPELTLSGHLEGLRYSAENFPQPAKTQEFTRPYVVSATARMLGTSPRAATTLAHISRKRSIRLRVLGQE